MVSGLFDSSRVPVCHTPRNANAFGESVGGESKDDGEKREGEKATHEQGEGDGDADSDNGHQGEKGEEGCGDEEGEGEEGEGEDGDDDDDDDDDGDTDRRECKASEDVCDVYRSSAERLMIDKVVLNNFKSYGGKTVIGPFHKCFSSIIGPNGSGKSNVVDAMLFVFGRRAKDIRLNRVSELIHNSKYNKQQSSSRHASTNSSPLSASVTVHFKSIIDKGTVAHPELYDVVPQSEFTVTRTAMSSNASQYYINDRVAKQRDVSSLLSSKGIDLENNRFLILQGEVEQIAQMKPKATKGDDVGLLEYLEDLIGSDKYIEEIEAKEKQLEEECEVVTEKRNRMRLAKDEMDSLEGPRQQAEAYCRSRKNIIQIKNKIVQKRAYEVEIQKEKYVEEMNANKGEWDVWKAERSEGDRKRVQTENDVERKTKLVGEMKDKLTELRSRFEKMDRECNNYNIKMSNGRKRIEKLNTEIAKLTKDSEECRVKVAEMNELQKRITPLIPDMERTADEAANKLEAVEGALQGETLELQKKKDEEERRMAPINSSLAESKRALDVSSAKFEMISEKQTKVKSEIESAKEKQKQCRSRLEDNRKLVETYSKTITSLKRQMEKKRNEFQKLTTELEEETKQLTHRRAKVEENERRHREERRTNELVSTVLEAKLKGVLGRLWDLGSASEEHLLAFSAVGGTDTIVTNTTEDAQAVVEFVRSRKLGRVTCVVRDKVESEMRPQLERFKKAQIPPNCQKLMDLVKGCKRENETCFFFVLRDTLLTADLDSARRLAFGGQSNNKYQIVTLEGQKIDKAGTMTGGKAVVASGLRQRTGERVSTEEIEKERGNLRDLAAKVEHYRNQRKALSVSLEESDKDITSAERQRSLCEAEIDSTTKEEKQVTSFLGSASLPQLNEEEMKQLKTIEKEMNELQKVYASNQSKHEEQQSKIKEINKKMENLGGEERRVAMKCHEEAKAQYEKAKKDVEEARVSSEVLVQKAKEKLDLIPKKKKEIEHEESQILIIDKDIEVLVEEAQKITESEEETKSELKTRLGDLTEAKSVLDEMKTKSKESGLKEVEFRKTDEDSKQRIEECKKYIKHFNKEIESIVSEWNNIPTISWTKKKKESSGKENEKSEKNGQREKKTKTENTNSNERKSKLENNEVCVEDESDGEDDGVKKTTKDECEEGNVKVKIEECTDSPTPKKEQLDDDEDALNTSLPREELKKIEMSVLEARLEQLVSGAGKVGEFDVAVIQRFEEVYQKYEMRETQYEEARVYRDGCKRKLDIVKHQREHLFKFGFNIISRRLKEMYQMLTLGGDAELELADEKDPFTHGISFSVRPPRKSWKAIQNLSGGEKTLSSLALVFALHYFKPTPIYFLDEIDAALDHRNVSIIANYISERAKDAQFIVISLRSQMFEKAERLVGIYKTHDVTHSISIDPDHFTSSTSVTQEDEHAALDGPDDRAMEGRSQTRGEGRMTETERGERGERKPKGERTRRREREGEGARERVRASGTDTTVASSVPTEGGDGADDVGDVDDVEDEGDDEESDDEGDQGDEDDEDEDDDDCVESDEAGGEGDTARGNTARVTDEGVNLISDDSESE